MFDIVGDIHGHADKLKQLLSQLGYSPKNGSYRHPDRTIIFVGDYIDRGPQIRETLQIVRNMVNDGNAIALLGNHEYNALCFHYEDNEGGHLRKHFIKNILQHHETLRQFQNNQKEYEGYIDWFKTLPLFFESPYFRSVHACWDSEHIEFLRSHLDNGKLNDDLIHESVKKDTRLHLAIDETLKGKEIAMPGEEFFNDKDGHVRKEIRIKWWENPLDSTYRQLSIEPLDNLPDTAVPRAKLRNTNYYDLDDKPVFFGHYWLRGKPMLYRSNVCCLDYSVAKSGYLVSYRFDNKVPLENSKMIFV